MTEAASAADGAETPSGAIDAWLRPRSATEILDGAFTLYRATFARVVTRMLLFGALPALAAVELPLVGQILTWLLTPAWMALGLREGMDELTGRPRPLGQALGRAARVWVPLLVLYLLYGLLLGAAALLALVPVGILAFFLAAAGVGEVVAVVAAVGWVAALVAAAVPWAYFGLYSPVYLFEGRGNPFARSLALVRGGFWKAVGVLLLAALIAALPTGVLQGAILLEGTDPAADPWTALAGKTWHVLATIGVSALVLPFTSFTLLLLWIDRRAVREGLDLGPGGPAVAAG